METYGGVVDDKYLSRVYEDLWKDQMNILSKMKNGSNLEIKDLDKNKAKEIQMITDLMTRIVKFRTFREQLRQKAQLS